MKILLVEDNDMNRETMLRRLERRGHEVIEATDGYQAIDMARAERPDIVLMDLRLPGMDGRDATRALKSDAQTRAIPVIALTAYAMLEDRESALNAGCNDFDTKPVDLERLLKKMHALVDK